MPIVANSSLVLFCTLPFSASLYILPVNANRYNICLSHTAIIYHCQCLRYFLRVCSFIGDFLISAISLLYLQLTIENDATNGSSKSCFLPGLCHCITYKVSLPHIYIYIYIFCYIIIYHIYTTTVRSPYRPIVCHPPRKPSEQEPNMQIVRYTYTKSGNVVSLGMLL